MDLTVAVFSFNRGDYLANCAGSVRRHLPAAVFRIHDDASDDPATRAVLADLAPHVTSRAGGAQSKHGGLYANMQAALEACRTRFILFLQDDMQVVRPLGAEDMADIAAIFDADRHRAFLCPTFVKGLRLGHARQVLHPIPGLRAFGMPPDLDPARRYAYGDVAIADVPRLRAAGWRFCSRERQSQDEAARLFSDMPYLAVPFVHFCPEVPVFRARQSGLAAWIARRFAGTGVKAFRDMTPAEVAALRAASGLPVAEDYLHTTLPVAVRPFVYQDIKVRPWLAALHRIETALRKGRT